LTFKTVDIWGIKSIISIRYILRPRQRNRVRKTPKTSPEGG
jgi:hypothetical protein